MRTFIGLASLMLAGTLALAPYSPTLAGRSDGAAMEQHAEPSDLHDRVSRSYGSEARRKDRIATKHRAAKARDKKGPYAYPWGPFSYPPGLF